MTDPRFDDQLASFLRWQAAQTAGAPVATDVAARLGDAIGRPQRSRVRPLRLILVASLVVAALILVGITLAGAFRPRPPFQLPEGMIVVPVDGCGLDGVDPATGHHLTIASHIPGCPPDPQSRSWRGLEYTSVAATADLHTIAYAREQTCGLSCDTSSADGIAAQGVYLVDLWTGASRRIDPCVDVRCSYSSVAVSPDGTSVAYSYRDRGAWGAEPGPDVLVIRDVSTGDASRIEGNDEIWDLHWSPDGRRLAFFSAPLCGGCDVPQRVEVVDADGRGRHVVTDAPGAGLVAWRADSQSLLVGSDGAPDGGTSLLRVVDVADGSSRTLLEMAALPNLLPSPDGHRIARTSYEGSVWLIDDDGTRQRQVGDAASAIYPVDWSPDGRQLLLWSSPESPDAVPEVLILDDVDGSTPRPLPIGTRPLAWLPFRP